MQISSWAVLPGALTGAQASPLHCPAINTDEWKGQVPTDISISRERLPIHASAVGQGRGMGKEGVTEEPQLLQQGFLR